MNLIDANVANTADQMRRVIDMNRLQIRAATNSLARVATGLLEQYRHDPAGAALIEARLLRG